MRAPKPNDSLSNSDAPAGVDQVMSSRRPSWSEPSSPRRYLRLSNQGLAEEEAVVAGMMDFFKVECKSGTGDNVGQNAEEAGECFYLKEKALLKRLIDRQGQRRNSTWIRTRVQTSDT